MNRSQRRYDAFRKADDGRTFAEFLGIKVPVEEYFMGRYRCINVDKGIWGDWSDTKKAAFDNYKEKLKTQKKRQELDIAPFWFIRPQLG